MAKNSSPSRAPKHGAQRQCELTEREKCRISLRKTPIRDLFHLRLLIRSSALEQVVVVVTQNLHDRHHVASLRWVKLRWRVQIESRSR